MLVRGVIVIGLCRAVSFGGGRVGGRRASIADQMTAHTLLAFLIHFSYNPHTTASL